MPRASLPQPDYMDLFRSLGSYKSIPPLDAIMAADLPERSIVKLEHAAGQQGDTDFVEKIYGVDPGVDRFSITAVSYNSKTGTVTDVTCFTETKNKEGQ